MNNHYLIDPLGAPLFPGIIYEVTGLSPASANSYGVDCLTVKATTGDHTVWWIKNFLGPTWAGKKFKVIDIDPPCHVELIDPTTEVVKGGEYRRRIDRFGATLIVGETYTIDTFWDGPERNIVNLTDGHYVQNPFLDKGLHVGRSFKVTGTDGGDAIIELIPASESVKRGCGTKGCFNLPELIKVGTPTRYSYCAKCSPNATTIKTDGSGPVCAMSGCSNPTELMDSKTDYWSFCPPCREDIKKRSSQASTISYDIETPLPSSTSSSKESAMNGTVYSGHVVRTKTVAAGEGVTTGVQHSEVVYSTTKPVITSSPDNARALILAKAVIALDGELDLEDPTTSVEVKLTTAS